MNWLLFYPAEFFLAGYTDCIVTINREDHVRARSFLRRRRIHRLKKVYRIPGVGVCTSRFAPDEKVRRQVRKELELGENIFYILYHDNAAVDAIFYYKFSRRIKS